MPSQKHIIKRQTIELTIEGVADAHQLQDELSRIYRRRLVPLIDRCCTEASQPGQIHRVDRLEIDLGLIDSSQLEEQLVARFLPALRYALGQEIDAQERATYHQGPGIRAASQLELFLFFARTGNLPWWADRRQPQLLDECLDYLLRTAPEQLRAVLFDLLLEERPLRRIVVSYRDELLALLADVVAQRPQLSLSNALPALIASVQATHAAAGQTLTQLRNNAWQTIFAVAGFQAEAVSTPALFYQAVLTQLAAVLNLAYDSLLEDVVQILQAGAEPAQRELQPILSALRQEDPGIVPGTAATLDRRLAQLQLANGPLAKLWAALRSAAPQLPMSLRSELQTILHDLGSGAATAAPLPPAALLQFIQRLPPNLPSATYRGLLSALEQLETRERSGHQLRAVIQQLQQRLESPGATVARPTQAPVDLSFSDAGEIYIENAGLVILWPFLSHFFGRLELLAERRFTDQAARQRAVGLLQHLATAELTFREYLLPLNKILCGLGLSEIFGFEPPVTAAEAEECDDLLRAVISQASILRDMSSDGFRSTFLLREGVLRARDGAWLLQVERETYDIVLDRFPWSWEWVKLPWMDAPLRVEWS